MAKLILDTGDGLRAFFPGDDVDVFAEWNLSHEAEAVEVRLIWYTRGKGDTDFRILDRRRFEHPSLSETRRLRFTLPDSPYSVSGKLVSVIWALELIALPAGESTRLDIVMAPQGKEIELYRSADDERHRDDLPGHE